MAGAALLLDGCFAALIRLGAGAGGGALAGRALVGAESASALAGSARAGTAVGRAAPGTARGGVGAGSPGAGDGAAAASARAGRLTNAEISFLRSTGVDPASAAAADLILGRSLTESHLTSLLFQREAAYLSRMPSGTRLYASLREGNSVEAGWLRKVDERTVVFNDGTRDLLLTQRDRNVLTHSSLRDGVRQPLAQTKILNDGQRFEYWTWSPSHGRYVYTGYGLPIPSQPGALRVYSTDHQFAGTLFSNSIRSVEPTVLPRATIISAITVGAVAVAALDARFERAPPMAPDGKPCNQGDDIWSRSAATGPEVIECRRVTQLLLEADGERLQFRLTPVEGGLPGSSPTRGKDPMFYVQPRS